MLRNQTDNQPRETTAKKRAQKKHRKRILKFGKSRKSTSDCLSLELKILAMKAPSKRSRVNFLRAFG
jgi:hypothetical protein